LVERKPVGRCSGNAAGIVKLPSLQASSWSSLAPSGIRAKRSAESPTDSGLPSQSSYAEAARPPAGIPSPRNVHRTATADSAVGWCR
jgi:hypothetical protein